jgi:hypothetical protein
MPTLPNQGFGESFASPEDDIVTADILAGDLRTDVTTVYKWAHRKIIPYFRINARCFRFSRREVREALARYRVKELEPAQLEVTP